MMIGVLAIFFPVLLSVSTAPAERLDYSTALTVPYATTDTLRSDTVVKNDTIARAVVPTDSSFVASVGGIRSELIAFAQTLKGTPYKYACSDPKRGFDCSGFVMYVFNHFQMTVPRSSVGFTHIGKEIELKNAMPGDVILFTGTNASRRVVGHVGIITQAAADSVSFIHASSGKAHSVTETTLGAHYKKRFMKVVRMVEN
jgi:cell wall-associated NlpC family hydrolase